MYMYVNECIGTDYTSQTLINFDWYNPHLHQHTKRIIKTVLTYSFSPPRRKSYSNQTQMHESVYKEFHIYVNIKLQARLEKKSVLSILST